MANGGIILQSVTAKAFLAVLDAGKAIVDFWTAAERLAGFDCHTGTIREACAGEGAGSGLVSTAEVGP